jgi:hypothetical protein
MIHVCLCEQEPKISVPIVWYRQNRRKKSSRWLVEEQIGGLIPEVGKQIECATMEATVVWVNQKTANFLRDFKEQ